MFDTFTAQQILELGMKDSDKAADLFKELKTKQGPGPSPEAIAFFEQHQGKKCRVKNTTHEGIIHKLNTSTAGFYSGDRYPIYIKITNADADYVFEYDLDQIEIIENK